MRTLPLATLICAAILAGCSSDDKTIISDPSQATVTINGDLVGTTPAKYKFDFDRHMRYDLAVSMDGYLTASTTIYSNTAQAGEDQLTFPLEKDPSWDDTEESPAANKWLSIQVLPQFDQTTAWQRLVDAITQRHPSLDKMDKDSFYIAAAPLKKSYKGGEVTIQTTVYANMTSGVSDKTITIRFMIESRRAEGNGNFVPWHRVFHEDVQLVNELQQRLGVK